MKTKIKNKRCVIKKDTEHAFLHKKISFHFTNTQTTIRLHTLVLVLVQEIIWNDVLMPQIAVGCQKQQTMETISVF